MAILLHHFVPQPSFDLRAKLYPSDGGVKRKRGSKIEGRWTYQGLSLIPMSRSVFQAFLVITLARDLSTILTRDKWQCTRIQNKLTYPVTNLTQKITS